MAETIGGKRAAQQAFRQLHAARAFPISADTVYTQTAANLGLFGVAFYGEHGTPTERGRLRDAWREAQAIAAANGYTRPFTGRDAYLSGPIISTTGVNAEGGAR